jgi:hypothetical protein
MRSSRGFAGSLIPLIGVVAAIADLLAGGGEAELIIHVSLGASFLLLAMAVRDFALPFWMNVAAGVAFAVFGAIFLLQALSDLTQLPQVTYVAFDLLGQRLERVLGYLFLLWCFAVLALDCRGRARLLGAIVLAIVFAAEAYGFALSVAGHAAPGVLKLLYLPVFAWLLVVSATRRDAAMAGAESAGR